MSVRRYSPLDLVLNEVGHFLQTVAATPISQRHNPAIKVLEDDLTQPEMKHAAGLIRVDHTGEICAQALYRGQAVAARTSAIRDSLHQAAQEENDHLAWCQHRLTELHSHPSYLNIFWYLASFKLGVLAGLAGDGFSMGFVEETEKQVVKHIDQHLATLPSNDHKSRAILQQMRIDEQKHATTAVKKGAKPLPGLIQKLMAIKSKIMTSSAYYL